LISHVFVGITDFPRAFQFYSSLMNTLGLQLKFADTGRPWAGWMANDKPRPLFLIGTPLDGEAATPGNGQMIALLAGSRDIVRAAHDGAIRNGGTCEGPPGLRPHYHPDYYGAYFRDPDGNKICVCCHDAGTIL
jgi:catechol 2,3-dioxygenase-like lactoylglutathione lyase family enzyme